MKNKFLIRIVRILLILLVFSAMVYFFQDKVIFIPTKLPADFKFPENQGNCHLQMVSIKTVDDIELNGIFVSPKIEGENKVALFCHGNAGNLFHRLEKITKICETGISIFAFDYRGFGKSSGSPDVAGAKIDGQTALNYLIETRKIPIENIILYGESLGTGIAAQLLKEKESQFAGVVLESGFASLAAQANRRIPFIGSMLLKQDLPTIDIMRNYQGKLLMIHSKNDGIIPYDDSKKVFAACPSEQKSFLTLEGVGHNDPVWNLGQYIEAWKIFKQMLEN